jgi:YVTN family beta-propeller protein
MKGKKFIGILLAFLMFASIFAIVSFTGGAEATIPSQAIMHIEVGSSPYQMAYDPQNNYIYVANSLSNNITVINGITNKQVDNISLNTPYPGPEPMGITYDSQNRYLYVANSYRNYITVINTATDKVIANISIGYYPVNILYVPDNGYIYITGNSNVTVYNPSTNQMSNISNGKSPLLTASWGLTYDPDNKYLYVTDDQGTSLAIINTQTNTLVKTLNVGQKSTDYAVYDPYNKYVYASNYNNIIYVINTNTNTFAGQNITLSDSPNGMVIDPDNHYLYVVFWASLVIINPSTNTQIGSISAISGDTQGACALYNPYNKYIYVTYNWYVDVFQVLTNYTVSFVESGLPSGTLWWVNLSNGQSHSGTGTTITFSIPNGTYSFTVATVNKSYKSPDYSIPNYGTFTVNGYNVGIGVAFTLVTYTITFNENGLGGIYGLNKWWVNLSNGQSFSSTGTTITFPEPNGTYSYTITSLYPYYIPIPSNGTFKVNGANVNINITFKTADGLNIVIKNITVGNYPQGMAYDPDNGYLYVTNENDNTISIINTKTNTLISNISVSSDFYPYQIVYAKGYLYVIGYNNILTVINTQTNKTITNITLDSYPYAILYDPDNQYLYVGGSNLTDFDKGTIDIISTSDDKIIKNMTLDNSQPWTMAYNPYLKYVYVADYDYGLRVINTSTNQIIENISIPYSYPTVVFYNPDNKYIYLVEQRPGYLAILNSLNYSMISYIRFSVNQGGGWGISTNLVWLAYDPVNKYIYGVDGMAETYIINTKTNTLIAPIEVGIGPNYILYDPDNYYIYVSNSYDNTVSIIKTVNLYNVSFTESGLPSGTTWYVNLSNGQSFSSTTNTITFPEPNGTYSYTIATVNESYAPSPSSGTFTVNNINVNINITFNQIIKGSEFPVANITAPSVVALDTVVILSGKNSTASAGATIINYTWNIYAPDNNHYIKYGEIISIYFNVAGAYTIDLTVKDSANKTNSTSIKINAISPSVDSNIQISYTLTVLSNGYYEYDVIVNAKDNISIVQFLASVDGIYANATLTKQMGYQYYYVVKFNPNAFGYGNHTIKFQAINSLNGYNTAITYATFGSLSQGGIMAYITGHIALTIVIIIFIIILLAFIYELYRNRAIKKLMKKKISKRVRK